MELLRDKRHILLKRLTNYCECDIVAEYVYSLYDLEKGSTHPVSFELNTTFRGEGPFYADKRGFFFGENGHSIDLAASTEPPHLIDIQGYVYGAQFSKDGNYVLIARSPSVGVDENLDLILYSFKDGSLQPFDQALKGKAEHRADYTPYPIQFSDDGEFVYTHMWDDEGGEYRYFRFDWRNQLVEDWHPADGEHSDSSGQSYLHSLLNQKTSKDGLHTIDPNRGLSKNDELVDAGPYGYGEWIGSTHQYVFEMSIDVDGASESRLAVLDAERMETTVWDEEMNYGDYILGGPKDGDRFYVVRTEYEP